MIHKNLISKQVDWKTNLEEFAQKVYDLFSDLEFDDQFYQEDWEEFARVIKNGTDIIRSVQLFRCSFDFQWKPSVFSGFLTQLAAILKSIYFHSDYFYNHTFCLSNVCFVINN